ncbi:acylphosphatase [Agrobacterium vitis]|nr:acylphosphatase [Agrobacterium vitis]MBE1439444.1 acylphosphatase [Agrobacterium vitis]
MPLNSCNTCEKLSIFGNVGAASFLPWIERHAEKLGLAQAIVQSGNGSIDLIVEGPLELIDAMEMGCWLGPIDVWVDTIVRTPDTIQRTDALL